jgi:alcohol dehydrogenase
MILAIGGGSTMDVAKAVGILATNGGRIHDYEGIDKFTRAPLPLIAIPSTAGTGSEVSGSCVITDTDNNRKMSIRHARLNPATHALLDPMAVATLPAHVAAHAGIDAFVHAIESYTSRLANLITDAINLEAISLISQNLRAFVTDRGDQQAAQKMLVGSSLTGIVFGQTGLGNVHCMARFVGAQYHLSHGLSNALCLPTVAQFNLSAAEDKYANIGRSMGVATPLEDANLVAQSAVLAIESLCRDVGIPSGLRDVGANPADFEAMAAACAAAGYNRWNPRETSQVDFLDLFKRAY